MTVWFVSHRRRALSAAVCLLLTGSGCGPDDNGSPEADLGLAANLDCTGLVEVEIGTDELEAAPLLRLSQPPEMDIDTESRESGGGWVWDAAILPSGRVVVATRETISLLAPSGEPVAEPFRFGSPQDVSVFPLPGDTFLVGIRNAVLRFDPSGTIRDTTSLVGFPLGILPDGSLLTRVWDFHGQTPIQGAKVESVTIPVLFDRWPRTSSGRWGSVEPRRFLIGFGELSAPDLPWDGPLP